MSSKSKEKQHVRIQKSRNQTPEHEHSGVPFDRKTFTEEFEHQNSIAQHLGLQNWNMDNHKRSPRNKKGNLEKVNKSRQESRGGNLSFNSSSQIKSLQLNPPNVYQSDAEGTTDALSQLSLSLGARPKPFPRQGGVGIQSNLTQDDRDISKAKISANSDKMVNPDDVNIKLKQIRDYINQITSTIETLEQYREPASLAKAESLRKIRTDLLENEHQLMELLENISILSRESLNDHSARSDASYGQENHILNHDKISDESAYSDEEIENETREDNITSDVFAKHSELLKKITDSQEKLKALQDHQTILLNLKQRVESRLSDTRVLHDHINKQTEDISRDERPAPIGHHQAQENRQRRFPSLQEDRSSANEGHEHNLADIDQGSDSKYRNLEKKWLGLQKERDQIDLLRELHLLQDNRKINSTVLQPGEKLAGYEQNCSKSKRNSNVPRSTAGISEADKTKKVEDKKWLKSLQGIESNSKKLLATNNNDQISNFVGPDYLPDEIRDHQIKKTRKAKKNNLSYNQDDNDVNVGASVNKQLGSNADIQQRLDFLISELHADLDDGHYEERTKKLSAARSKLQKLQDILTVVQQAQQDGETISEDYVEQLLDSVDGDDLIHNEVQIKDNIRPNRRLKNYPLATDSVNAKGANDSKSKRKFTFDNPKQTQRMDPVGMNDSRRESNTAHDVPTISLLQDASGDLWADMRRQLSLTEELRHRRRELESLMQKDAGKSYLLNQDIKEENQSAKSEPLRKSTASVIADSMSAATWGGSSFDTEAQETVDGTNDSQEEKTEVVEDEEYSSDGQIEVAPIISSLQNENRSSKVSNRISPVVEYNHISRSNPSTGVNVAEVPVTDPLLSARKRSFQLQQLPSFTQEQFNEGGVSNISIFEDAINNESIKISIPNANPGSGSTSGALNQPPLETTALLYQTLFRDQNIIEGLARQSLLPNSNVQIPSFNPSEAYCQQQFQMQQQMLLGLSQCYKLLYLQNAETQKLQQFVQNILPHVGGNSNAGCCMSFHGRSNSCEASGESHAQGASSHWHRDNVATAGSAQAHRLSQSSNIPDAHETLNNQVAPGNRANNYWDNFRSYSRQNLLSNAHHLNKSNDGVGRFFQADPHLKTHPVNVSDSHEHLRQPMLIQEHIESNEERHFQDHTKCSPRNSRPSDLREQSDSSVIVNHSKNKVNKDLSHSSPISKALVNCENYFNNSSGVLSHPGNYEAITSSRIIDSGSVIAASGAAAVVTASPSDVVIKSEGRSTNRSQTEEEIQSAITKLMSRCCNESDVIVDLLRELQKLNSQQEFTCALQVVRNFVSDFAKNQKDTVIPGEKLRPVHLKESSSSDADVEMRTVHHHQGCLPKDRPRFVKAQESSSDDDSFSNWPNSRKVRHHKDGSRHHYLSLDRIKPIGQQPGPHDAKIQPLETKNSFSNKASAVNRKLYKNRTSSSQSQNCDGQELENSSPIISTVDDHLVNMPNPDVHISSSDVPSTRFNVRQLETQMQDVMSSVTSFVALLSSRNFNSALMGIVTSRMIDLVLSMVDNLNEYTMSFVPGHLESVLNNILPKYFGKRVSDCESSLVTELSEILFNELALLQLMQNMVNGNKSLKLACPSFDAGKNSDLCSQTSPSAIACEMQISDLGYHSIQQKGSFTEATDADLVLTTKRADDDDNEKSKEDFSCDIPDVCVSHENSGALANGLMDERSLPMFRSINEAARISPSSSIASHGDSHNLSQLSELNGGGFALDETCAKQNRYFDLEVELEECLGDTQDLAEADQTHRYMGVDSLDDDVHNECVENWVPNHNVCNGNIERTEDDQQDENGVIGAVGGVGNAFQTGNTMDGIPTRIEMTLDEVPIKLRVGNGSGTIHDVTSESDNNRKNGNCHEK